MATDERSLVRARRTASLALRHGRTVDIDSRGGDELLEIRDSRGMVELRVRLTDDGVVLQLEGARISLRAADSVDVECKSFNVIADGSVHVESKGDVHVKGKLVHLN